MVTAVWCGALIRHCRYTIAKEASNTKEETPEKPGVSKNWRKGSFLRPFCHLLIKAIRQDSPPFDSQQGPLSKLLLDKRLAVGATQKVVAARFDVSARTLKNWEHDRNKPAKSLWPQIHQFLGGA
ncbi:MAG: helix-turn-helix transcriptional regulator [Verrucomicrobiota bacterium]|jgi:DNA-binding XRE family transcriptional regulator